MVQCKKCEFRTRYPGRKKCWMLDGPLCGTCAYLLDRALIVAFGKIQKNREFKKLMKKFVKPVYDEFKQPTELELKLYEKKYVRKPSIAGGRLNENTINQGDSLLVTVG